MNVEGARAVVTGAAGGIGAAVARRLLDRGASVVLTDLDADRLATTAGDLAGELPGRVVQLAGDAGDDEHLRALVAAADEAFGDVDLFVANAGVFVGFGLGADDDAWGTSWDVNVMAHVRAARLLAPRWVERAAAGGPDGCFVSTASAAGLLLQLGSPTYTVTKHAALGFAEWLAATYGDRGVQVCCLCPMGVRTPMVEAGETSPDPDARLAHASVSTAGEVVDPSHAADTLLDAVEAGRFLALPHPEVDAMQQGKAADRDHWIAGMQRFRRSLRP